MNTILSHANAVVRQSAILFRNLLSGLFILCLMIRLLIKDSIDALSVVYYSTPLPILALFALLLCIIWLLCKRRRIAKVHFGFALGCLILWSYQSFSLNSRVPATSDVKLYFWNTANNRRAEEITDYIRRFDADIIGIVEAGFERKKVNLWKHAFPEYEIQFLPGDMTLITKGKILSQESGALGRRGRFNLLKVALSGEIFQVLLVDLDGDPLRSRAPAFEPLAKMIRSYSQANLIVMGDFNTPLDSVLFESFRHYLTHAFERGGNGFAETWPAPLPLLAIDHIWVSNNMEVASCKLNWSRLSDHRSVVAHIELSPGTTTKLPYDPPGFHNPGEMTIGCFPPPIPDSHGSIRQLGWKPQLNSRPGQGGPGRSLRLSSIVLAQRTKTI